MAMNMNRSNIKFFRHVFLDVVGYSKRNEDAQARITAAQNEITLAALEEYGINETERILLPLGDGVCIALLSAPENFDIHLRVALSILRRLSEHNEQDTEHERFEVRIGIHEHTDNLVTDINGNPNVAGDGINLAKRIMDLADGRQILVSHVVYMQLYKKEMYEGKLRPLSEASVKHGVPLQVFQYIEENVPGLDCNLPAEWQRKLSDQDKETTDAIDRPVAHNEALNEQVQIQAVETALTEPEASTAEKQSGEQQIAEAVGTLSEAIRQEDFARGVKISVDLDDFHLLRFQLLTSTWLAEQVPSSMLGIHEANRLYLYRERLQPTGSESVSLLRMLINDHLSYVPGWYWFKGIEAVNVEAVILRLAFSDSYSLVRQRAFALLSYARVPLPDGIEENMSRIVTSHFSPDVREAALSYIGSVGGPEYLPIIGSALVDRDRGVSYQAKVSKYLLLARTEPDRALKELLDEKSIEVEDILNELNPEVEKIAPATLLKALEHSKDELRLFAIKALIRRDELTIELATPRKEDKYDQVKAVAYRFLIERGVELETEEIVYKVPENYFRWGISRNLITRPSPPIEREQILLEFYRRYDVDQLAQMADWNQWPPGHEAYRALALEHFAEFAERLKEDLRTDFGSAAESHYQWQLEEWQRITAEHERAQVGKDSFNPESMAQSEVERRKAYYIAAALAGLASNGSSEDIEFGRRFLPHTDNDVKIEAIKIIQRFGNADDAPSLIEIAKSSEGFLQELAAQTALSVSNYQHEVAGEFLATGNEILLSVTVAEMITHGDKETVGDFFREYLNNDNEKVRTRVMAFYVFRYDSQELEEILAQYINKANYYYDVVCCFDRILYAPPRLGLFYRRSIENSFFGLLIRDDESLEN
jgi:class 3 adenylate cyclase/HEAT repeat protein